MGNRAYFIANDNSSGREIWSTDGTASGTTQLVDLEPGTASPDLLRFVRVGDALVIAVAGRSGAIDGIYRSDGTAAGTVRLRSGNVNASRSLIASGPVVYFVLTENSGESLWLTDGTAAGTRSAGAALFGLNSPIGRGGALFFEAGGVGVTGIQLWMSDGTSAGTRQLSTVDGPGIPAGVVGELISFFNDRPLFAAEDRTRGIEPFLVTNQFPTAVADSASVVNNTTVLIDALSNDTDPDGNIRRAGVLVVRQPANGTVTLESGSVRYAPRSGFVGSDSFEYRVIDDFGGFSSNATVTISVSAPPPPPPPPPPSGGGGGALTWLQLLALAALCFASRRLPRNPRASTMTTCPVRRRLRPSGVRLNCREAGLATPTAWSRISAPPRG
jgi:ELWxxDGT repeat protein